MEKLKAFWASVVVFYNKAEGVAQCLTDKVRAFLVSVWGLLVDVWDLLVRVYETVRGWFK